jgi:hypothetical protein
MKPLVRRILVGGLPVAAALAVIGYLMAELAGGFLSNHPTASDPLGAELAAKAADTFRTRMPLGMAAWGFGLVALYEVVLFVLRGNPPPPTAPPAKAPAPTDAVLKDLLTRADAAGAVPAPAPCPPAGDPDNTRTAEPTPPG